MGNAARGNVVDPGVVTNRRAVRLPRFAFVGAAGGRGPERVGAESMDRSSTCRRVRVAAISRPKLLEFCEYVYMRGAATAGQHAGWAGRVAAMICASWNYSPFDDGIDDRQRDRARRARENPDRKRSSLRLTRR